MKKVHENNLITLTLRFSHTTSGKADAKDAQISSGTMEEAAEKSEDNQDVGGDDEADDGPSWDEMERYSIMFERWMKLSEKSKLLVKLPVPTNEPPARKDQVACNGHLESM